MILSLTGIFGLIRTAAQCNLLINQLCGLTSLCIPVFYKRLVCVSVRKIFQR